MSPPFALDTHLPLAFTGTVNGGSPLVAIPGALVELFLGSTMQQSTSSDAAGHFEFFATTRGDYVIRVTKSGFAMVTSDLQRFRGGTLTANITLPSSNGAPPSVADLVIGSTDLTYTVVNNGALTITAMVHNVGGLAASNVHVRFFDASTGSGVNQYAAITPDAVLASLAPGEAKPASVSWRPASGHQRFYAFADPDHQVAEVTEQNNASAKDLGAYGRQPPRVTSVSAKYDRYPDPHFIGQFLSGIRGATNVFYADVASTDDDVGEVDFDFQGTVVKDTDGSDGWSVPFDTGTLSPGVPALTVTAYNSAGVSSQAFVSHLLVYEWPSWMRDNFSYNAGPVSFKLTKDYLDATFSLKNRKFPGLPVAHFTEQTDDGVLLIGSKSSTMSMDVQVSVSFPIDPTLPWKASGKLDATETVFDQTLGRLHADFDVHLSPDGRTVQDLTVHFQPGPLSFSTPEVSVPIGQVGPVTFSAGLSLEAQLALLLEGSMQNNFAAYQLHLTPEVTGTVKGTLRASAWVAKAELILAPTARLTPDIGYEFPPGDMSISGEFSAQVDADVVASIGWKKWSKSKTLLHKTWGPWSWTYPRSTSSIHPLGATSTADVVTDGLPLFPFPAAATGPQGEIGVCWASDLDPSPERDQPAIFFAERTPAGVWQAPVQVTSGNEYVSVPALDYLPDGRPMVIWVQNGLTESEIGPDLTLSEVADRQDLWFSVRGTSGWSAPAPLIQDQAAPFRADGVPAVSGTGSGALAVWVRAMGDSALAPGGSELFSSTFAGSSWSTPTRITDDQADDGEPTLAQTFADTVTCVWVREEPAASGLQSLLWSRWDGNAWGPIRPLRDPGGMRKQQPSLAASPDGRLLLSWVEAETGPDATLRYHLLSSSKASADTIWDAPAEVATDSHFIETPLALVDQRGIGAVTWRGFAGNKGALMTSLRDLRNPGSPWSAPRQITSDTLMDWMPAAAIDDQNNLHAVYLASDLSGSTAAPGPAGPLRGLSVASRAIAGDLQLNDQLNFGFRSLSSDLVLASGSVSIGSAHPVTGDTIVVTASVGNIGDIESIPTTVQFYDGAPDSGGVLLPGGEVALGAISPDGTRSVAGRWPVLAGLHRLYAVADPSQAVPEQTESNNRSFVAVTIVPDLVMDGVEFRDANPTPGTSDTVVASFHNVGGATATGYAVRLKNRAGILVDAAGPALAPGQTATVRVDFTAAVGVDTVSAEADPANVIGDPDRSNNLADAALRVLPDLSVLADSISYGVSGSNAQISAVVANLGSVASGPFEVTFYRGNPLADGVPLDSVHVEALPSFEQRRVAISWIGELGTSTIYVVADRVGAIEERDRGNNQSYSDVVLSGLPDLKVIPGSIAVQTTGGPPFQLSVAITDAGAAHCLGVGVEFYRGDPNAGGTLIGDRMVSTLALAETLTVTVPWDQPDPVQNPVYAVVDRSNAIPELDETNNAAQHLFGPIVGVPTELPLPTRVALRTARPNPFTSRTEIHFDLPVAGPVDLALYDLAGRMIRALVGGPMPAGFHVRSWDGRDDRGHPVPAGIYFVRLDAGGGRYRSKVVKLE